MAGDEMTIGSYPRDDVFTAWVKDGQVREGSATILVARPDGRHEEVGRVSLGDVRVVQLDLPAGTEVTVQLSATYGVQRFERTITVTATADEDDVCVSAIGPGATAERGTGLLKRTRYAGFVFGVLVMSATTQDGTDVSGQRGALMEHGPRDGVG